MKRALLTSAVLAAFMIAGAPLEVLAQRDRNPGGGGAGGSSGGDGGTGRVAVPRDGGGGGGSTWGGGGGGSSWGGGGAVGRRPSEPVSTGSSGGRTAGRRPARTAEGSDTSLTVPPYSRPRNGAPVVGYAVPRQNVGTLPPIISGPIYWGPDSWYFYPWGYGSLALGYFWDPWMWSGYMGGWGGYPYDPYLGGGYYGAGGGGWGGRYDDDDDDRDDARTSPSGARSPLDPYGPHGGLRLKVEPRDAEVYVDGFYAGRVDDFDGAMQRLKIAAGPHRVEIKAPGYETTTFDVTIIDGETTTYRTTLKKG